jgi:sarcosine oxidase, subunit beta
MAGRIVVAGAGAIGASVAYHLAESGARGVVLCDVGDVASGATGRAMGGVRQQFSTAAEVRLTQSSIAFFRTLGAELFRPVGYMFLATTPEGLARLNERVELQRSLGVPIEDCDAGEVDGLYVDDVLGAVICREDGVADPPAVARELVCRAVDRGVELCEQTDARALDGETLVIACGWESRHLAAAYDVDLPIRPLCRQLVEVGPVTSIPSDLPMVLESESGFHFRRSGDRLRLAMNEPTPRWTDHEEVDDALVADWRERIAYRFPAAEGARVARSWAGLYDMTPDAHPIIGWVGDGVYAACGFSGHGFMQSPAVGKAVAEQLLDGESSFDLSPYRLERFDDGAVFPEEIVL